MWAVEDCKGKGKKGTGWPVAGKGRIRREGGKRARSPGIGAVASNEKRKSELQVKEEKYLQNKGRGEKSS